MPLVLANRVQESATANTTVSFTLTGAIAGFQTFAVIGDTNTTYYSATDGAGNWEVGLGTYSTTGPTLTRTTVYASSNSNLAVTFSGTVNVFVTYPSGRSVNLDASGNVSALGTVASGTWQGSTVGVAYGGTGLTSYTANQVLYAPSSSSIGQSANLTFDGTRLTVADFSDSSLTSGRVTYAGAGGNLTDASNFTFNGFNLTVNSVTFGRSSGSSSSGSQSVAAGGLALFSNTSGDYNSALGYAALQNNETNNYSTAVGWSAAKEMRGNGNTAVGGQALQGNFGTPATNTGTNNTAIGVAAGYSTTTGSYNVAVGVNSLISISTGSYNTTIGFNSLSGTATSSNNTTIGYNAGSALTSGSNNVIIGSYNGNQNNLDIRTASNYAVLSDGAGNRIISGGSGLSVALGNSAVPQSGTGITFPATQSSSSNVNTLDDYEEGTFTPSLQGSTGTGSVTYAARAGHYTKIGDLVYATVWIQLNSGSFTGTMQVGGLPFTVRNATNNYAPISIGYVDLYAYTQYYQLMGYANVNTTTVILTQAFSNTASSNAPVDASFAIMFSVTYKTAT